MNEEDFKAFVSKAAEMRVAQEKFAKTLSYGYRRESLILAKELDKMLDSILGNDWKKV
jgi:hypothetical protein